MYTRATATATVTAEVTARVTAGHGAPRKPKGCENETPPAPRSTRRLWVGGVRACVRRVYMYECVCVCECEGVLRERVGMCTHPVLSAQNRKTHTFRHTHARMHEYAPVHTRLTSKRERKKREKGGRGREREREGERVGESVRESQ